MKIKIEQILCQMKRPETLYWCTGEITIGSVERTHEKFVHHSPQAHELDISSFSPNALCGKFVQCISSTTWDKSA